MLDAALNSLDPASASLSPVLGIVVSSDVMYM